MGYSMFALFRLVIAILVSLYARGTVQGVIINTKQGSIEGTTLTASNGRIFNAFYGVPYALQPVGELRFKPPVAATAPWKSIINGTSPYPVCLKIDEDDEYVGQEDCLYMDIYTPKNTKAGDNVPIIVYIFGGAFYKGSTTQDSPAYLMGRDITLVMISSRLGPLGYFSTGDSVISGNMGLKDQTMALRWVRENIYEFGGDPTRVTLMGHSSGAASVHFHTLSPLSKGLFSGAIMQSGLAVAPQCFFDLYVVKSMSKLLAKMADCPTDSSEKILQCLQSKDAKYLVRLAKDFAIWNSYPQALFRPTVEDKSVEGAFITDIPLAATYPSTEISLMTGITTQEGAYYVNEMFDSSQHFHDMDGKLLLPMMLQFIWHAKPNHFDYLSDVIKSYYFGEEKIGPSTDIGVADMLTGAMHGGPLVDVVDKFNGTKFLYLFDYRTNFSAITEAGDYNKYLGIGHEQELFLLLDHYNAEDALTETDKIVSNELITRWINFAYTGNPNEPFPIDETLFSRWTPMVSHHIEFLHLQLNGSMESDYFRERFHFWKRIPFFSKYSIS